MPALTPPQSAALAVRPGAAAVKGPASPVLLLDDGVGVRDGVNDGVSVDDIDAEGHGVPKEPCTAPEGRRGQRARQTSSPAIPTPTFRWLTHGSADAVIVIEGVRVFVSDGRCDCVSDAVAETVGVLVPVDVSDGVCDSVADSDGAAVTDGVRVCVRVCVRE